MVPIRLCASKYRPYYDGLVTRLPVIYCACYNGYFVFYFLVLDNGFVLIIEHYNIGYKI